jgi:hypothetical protein
MCLVEQYGVVRSVMWSVLFCYTMHTLMCLVEQYGAVRSVVWSVVWSVLFCYTMHTLMCLVEQYGAVRSVVWSVVWSVFITTYCELTFHCRMRPGARRRVYRQKVSFASFIVK